MTGYFIVESPDAKTSIEIRSDGGSYMMYTVDWMKDERLKLGYIEWDKRRRNLRKLVEFLPSSPSFSFHFKLFIEVKTSSL